MNAELRTRSPQGVAVTLAALVLLIAASCGSTSEPEQVVRGSVTYRERIALTPDATLIVQLRDTSLMDVAAELIAEQVIPNPGQVPISFEIAYESDRIEERNTYSVSARIIEAGGRLAFINDTAYDVITRGNPTSVDMVLVLVEPPPETVDGEWESGDDRPVETLVTVTGERALTFAAP